ncbi:uncharacterized protein ANIA_07266 [Aspergillus nidulans FGSC A4]|uniref:Uncharacterized protein n=1 Tax=Emericella nidulans (strain FGSC A4 / ATCC 38163 / CBS 112.46 / NRRL 194 / M139) TaxID=227321 RepID=C8VCU4_EMENI|nr:hypothetical protein [Aspergillus nidulans FGSC A4]CBF78737.1 TPA: hypothetical protein ANIA_07266 [Aspergillus nidulans FGSC A4]
MRISASISLSLAMLLSLFAIATGLPTKLEPETDASVVRTPQVQRDEGIQDADDYVRNSWSE